MRRIGNLVEELKYNKNLTDLRNSFFEEDNPSRIFLNLYNGQQFDVRLLGPFVKARKIFIDTKKYYDYFSKDEVIKIFNGDEATYNSVITKIVSMMPKSMGAYGNAKVKTDQSFGDLNYVSTSSLKPSNPVNYEGQNELLRSEADSLIRKIWVEKSWQKCILSNVLVRNNTQTTGAKLRLFSISNSNISEIVSQISAARKNIDNVNISGLFAHDIQFSKIMPTISTRHAHTELIPETNNPYVVFRSDPMPISPKPYVKTAVRLSKDQTLLKKDEIEFVFSMGLWNIMKVVEDSNAILKKGYYFKIISDYKMDQSLFEDMKVQYNHDEEQHFEQVEEDINDIPEEAFENRIDTNNPIESLDI